VVYGLINEVVSDMPSELVATLFAKVAQQPADDYSEMYVEFLKDFTVRALGADEDASYVAARVGQAQDGAEKQEKGRPDIQR
jgi:hypothetical protein